MHDINMLRSRHNRRHFVDGISKSIILYESLWPVDCVIYVREDNDSNVQAMITRLIWTTWTSLPAV